MAVEIERKFLVANSDWRAGVVKTCHFRDGLVSRFGEGKVRVRQAESRAWITVKGPRSGISRAEFEYEIPPGDAEAILELCHEPPVEKLRHLVPHAGLTWAVDEHLGPLAGILFAEIELEHPEQHVSLPSWVGEEVTNDPRYSKRALFERCAEGVVQSGSQGR